MDGSDDIGFNLFFRIENFLNEVLAQFEVELNQILWKWWSDSNWCSLSIGMTANCLKLEVSNTHIANLMFSLLAITLI